MFMLGDPMSILARRTRAPSGNSPARIPRNRSRFSSTGRSRDGLLRPGSGPRLGQRAAVLPDLLGREVVDVGKPAADQLLGPLVELLEVVGGEVEMPAP